MLRKVQPQSPSTWSISEERQRKIFPCLSSRCSISCIWDNSVNFFPSQVVHDVCGRIAPVKRTSRLGFISQSTSSLHRCQKPQDSAIRSPTPTALESSPPLPSLYMASCPVVDQIARQDGTCCEGWHLLEEEEL